MKTYLLNIPQRLLLKDKQLDACAILCDKAWSLFNDEGVKQLFIFQKDGSLYITTDGVVTLSSWRFIPANDSIIITANNSSLMFHPAFLDESVFALKQDGSQLCLFMIEEKNQALFQPNNLKELQDYFINKEKKLLEEQYRNQQLEKERLETCHKELIEEAKGREELERAENELRLYEVKRQNRIKKLREQIEEKYKDDIAAIRESSRKKRLRIIGIIGAICGFVIVILLLEVILHQIENDGFVNAFSGTVIVGLALIMISASIINPEASIDEFVSQKYKELYGDLDEYDSYDGVI